MSQPNRNVELKAWDRDPERSLSACRSLGAEACGVLAQRDTYFNAPTGRLKLRETEGEAAQLIAYERPDNAGHRTSAYRIVEIEDADGVRHALADTLGSKAVVMKRRRLFIWEGVRIHLDEVEGLGSFIEFEAITSPESDLSPETKRVRHLRDAFEIAPDDIVGGSYCDLLSADVPASAGESSTSQAPR